jgi:hypothetical protein
MGGGISANQIPMHIDLETFRKIVGGTFNDSIFDEFAVDGVMNREKLLELAQTTDCFLSLDRSSTDIYGRSNVQRALKVANDLRARGLTCWILEEHQENGGSALDKQKRELLATCGGIDRARAVIMFMTEGYVQRVAGRDTTDMCQIEFQYTLRQRFPERMIPLLCEETMARDASRWTGLFQKYLPEGPKHPNACPFFSDEPAMYGPAFEALYLKVLQLTRQPGSMRGSTQPLKMVSATPATAATTSSTLPGSTTVAHNHNPLPQTPGLPPQARREDAQFFQWLARCCAGISDQMRVVYLGAFEVAGIRTVHDLAACMQRDNDFLLRLGVKERDADDIALAVSDLGLGYNPVRDFSNATTVESAVYAMRKSCQATEDAELGANALACVARISRANSDMPVQLDQAGCCEPIVKILQRNLGHARAVENAYLALQGLAVDDTINAKLGDINACEVVPRALASHLENAKVVEEGCRIISMLSRNVANNNKLGTAGACDVVMRGLFKHLDSAAVAEQGCYASKFLAQGNFENVGKLGYHNACEALSKSLLKHYKIVGVSSSAIKAMTILAVEPENRSRMGKLGGCEGTVAAVNTHINEPAIVMQGMRLIATMVIGNANNRTLFGEIDATTTIKNVLHTYSALRDPNTDDLAFPEIIQWACTGIYSLAAGSPQNQRRLQDAIPLLTALLGVISAGVGSAVHVTSPTYSGILPEAQEALLRISQ